jgi:uncharacterized protein (DUF1697 family)
VPGPKSTTVIALLRGINVGGKNKLAMADLRSIAAEAGYPTRVTYVQSGNLVLPSVPAGKVGSVAAVLHAGIAERTGLDIPVITRTASEWRAMIDANPFPDAAADGTKLHVIVLDGPASSKLKAFDALPFAPEELSVREREVYLSLPTTRSPARPATGGPSWPWPISQRRRFRDITGVERIVRGEPDCAPCHIRRVRWTTVRGARKSRRHELLNVHPGIFSN